MRILFIENREKTILWEQVAGNLQRRGHSIAWLVQNPQFIPKAFTSGTSVHTLPFPRLDAAPSASSESWVREHHPAVLPDRGRRYFNAGTAHYRHYTAAVEEALHEVCPDAVVGESTLFHELIAIDRCRVRGIRYIHPSTNRYPEGRFSLFAFDSQVPISVSGEVWPEATARALAERIATGRELPFYMHVPGSLKRLVNGFVKAATRGRIWWGRLRGERYNTPSLRRKIELYRQVRRNLICWRKWERLPAQPMRTILYPLQMQPEANLDVWGREFSNQVALVEELLRNAPRDIQIAVKANPKAKYELSDELLSLAKVDKRVCLLPLDMPMTEALAQCLGAITVTGTVGLEAVCGKGRCVSLCHPLLEHEFPAFHATSPANAVQRLRSDPQAGVGSVELGARLIRRLVEQSFVGRVSDPVSYPNCMEPDNVDAVASAVHKALESGCGVPMPIQSLVAGVDAATAMG